VRRGETEGTGDIALGGGGPAALVLASALARRGVRTTVFERDVHPDVAPRFNPDRSYLFENRYHMLRASLAILLGLSIFDQAKSADIPYSEVRRRAERLWPLWAA